MIVVPVDLHGLLQQLLLLLLPQGAAAAGAARGEPGARRRGARGVHLVGAVVGVTADALEQGHHFDELLPEGVVVPAVEERVVARGGHGHDVGDEEGEVVEAPAVDGPHVQVWK